MLTLSENMCTDVERNIQRADSDVPTSQRKKLVFDNDKEKNAVRLFGPSQFREEASLYSAC